MLSYLDTIIFSLSANATADASQSGMKGDMLSMIIVWGIFFVVLYFLFIRPSSKQRKQEELLRKNLEVGDEIVTIGGIVGRVVAIKNENETFILESGADKTKIKFTKAAIASNLTAKQKFEAEKARIAEEKKKNKKSLKDKMNDKLEANSSKKD